MAEAGHRDLQDCRGSRLYTGNEAAVVALQRVVSGITGDAVMQGCSALAVFDRYLHGFMVSTHSARGKGCFEQLMVKTWCTVSDANGTLHINHWPGCSSPWSSAAAAMPRFGAVRSSHGPESVAWENEMYE